MKTIVDLDSTIKTKELIPNFSGSHKIYTFKKDDQLYYFKEMPIRELIGELIALEIAKIIDIPILDFDIATLGQSYGTLSKSFQMKKERKVNLTSIIKEYFINHNDAEDIDFDFFMKKSLTNLEDIWFALAEKYQNQTIVANLMNSITDIFCFDMLTNQGDRHLGNFVILETETTVKLAPCYDNSSIYSGRKPCLGVDHNDFSQSNEEEILIKFLSNCDEIQKERFFTMYTKLNNIGISSIITKIEQDYHIPIYSSIKEDFINEYDKQMNLISQCFDYSNKL